MKYFWLHVVHHSSYFMFENFIRNKILEKNFTEFGVVPPNCGILDQLLNFQWPWFLPIKWPWLITHT